SWREQLPAAPSAAPGPPTELGRAGPTGLEPTRRTAVGPATAVDSPRSAVFDADRQHALCGLLVAVRRGVHRRLDPQPVRHRRAHRAVDGKTRDSRLHL